MDYEIRNTPQRTSTTALLESLGADPGECKAVWYGLPQAAFVSSEQFEDTLELTSQTLRTFAMSDCMADALLTIVRELRSAEECTCTFGHEGAFQVEAILADACSKRAQQGDLALLRDVAPAMLSFSSCESGKAMGRAVLQALELFSDEIEAHIERRQCPTGGCAAFKTFHILVSRCTGCSACLDACEDGAIMGKPRFVHVVDQNKCTQCGRCLDACSQEAVVRAGTKKPKTPPRPIPVKR